MGMGLRGIERSRSRWRRMEGGEDGGREGGEEGESEGGIA